MEKIAAYDALKPQQYGVIERLELALADMTRYPAFEQDLVLELRPFASVDRRRLLCFGVPALSWRLDHDSCSGVGCSG
jgi:hypothetical protein